jgi:NAD(P)-dependent dehydrogenase (short-subunit alcohol dehydrogenase family)
MNEGILSGRTALVTSSSRNLGAEIARSLAGHGARVAIHSHESRDAAERLVSELERSGAGEHVVLGADSTRMEAVRGLVREAATRLGGRIDILINNTGPFSITPLAELPESEWDRVMDANLKAAYVASQAAAPAMRTSGWGRIVNVGAGSAYLRNHSVYGLAKHAVAILTEELALELGPEVTVNAVAPGQILESAGDVGEVDPTFVERAVERTPLRRLVTRREVAEIVAALCSPLFDGVTGATIPIDGGWRLNRF